jgi:hypothetical protein
MTSRFRNCAVGLSGVGLAMMLALPVHAADTQLLDILLKNGSITQEQYNQLAKTTDSSSSAPAASNKASTSLYTSDDGKTTVSGVGFMDLTNIEQKSNGTKVSPTGTGIDVKRFYLGVNHDFDPIWSANLTTDFNYITAESQTQVYVKKAYVQAKLSDAAVIRVGSADMPWIPYVEGMYGYRYVENTLIDRYKFGTSADWGVHAGGKLADGMVNYAVSAVNGAGYKNPSRSKTMDFEGRIGFEPIKGLNLGAGFYNGELGQESQGTSTRTARRWNAVAAYVNPLYRVGAEYFTADNWNNSNNNAVLTANSSDKADGYSVWGSVNPMEKVSLFTRFDSAKPNKDTAPTLKDTYYNLGTSYQLRKNVDVALAYKHEKVENGSVTTASSGKIGGTTDGTYNEIGLWSQVKF